MPYSDKIHLPPPNHQAFVTDGCEDAFYAENGLYRLCIVFKNKNYIYWRCRVCEAAYTGWMNESVRRGYCSKTECGYCETCKAQQSAGKWLELWKECK